MSGIRLYVKYVSIILRSAMQYKMSFFLSAVGQFLVSFNVFLGIYFMFGRFHEVKGYSYSEVLLCFSVVLMEFSVAECFARGFDAFSGMVRQGEFDRIMVRPRSPVLQVLGSKFELTRIGRFAQALVMFVYGVGHCPAAWTWTRVLTVFLMVFGGVLLFCGIFMVYAALCFFTLEGLEFMNVLTDGAKEHGKYPFDVYGKRILQICTFVVPYALVQYFPLQYVLGRTDQWQLMFCPFGTVPFFLICYGVWRFGVRHYQSAGS